MSQQVFNIAFGDPNGFIQAQKPALCYTDRGGLWAKTSDELSLTGWTCVIAEPVTE